MLANYAVYCRMLYFILLTSDTLKMFLLCCYTRRLLGANTTADVLHLTNTLTSAAGPARLHLVSGDELRVITRADEPLFDELFPVSSLVDIKTFKRLRH
jgi:hypothetical protein